MLNSSFHLLNSRRWIPLSDSQYSNDPEEANFATEIAGRLEEVPVMSATVLGLEMLLHDPCIDLSLASELVLSDVGATIHVLRLIGREFESAAERPSRMVECLASLDVESWFTAISAQTYACDQEHSHTAALWRHSRLVAQYAKLIAYLLNDISPEDAYLVGLLHEIGSFPALLGWRNADTGDWSSGFKVASEESLPLFVVAAMREANDAEAPSVWKFILTAAHRLADIHSDANASPTDDRGQNQNM